MGGHTWSVTSEDADCERGRKSKIRARLYLEHHESYNFYYYVYEYSKISAPTDGCAAKEFEL